MKNLFLTLVVVLFVNVAFANNVDPKPVLVETSRELSHMLNSIYTEAFLEKEESSRVLFVVNDLNQIVVLKIQSENPDVQNYIKKALNYNKLTSKQLIVGEHYMFIVKFKLDGQQ